MKSLKRPGHHRPALVDEAERPVAILDAVDDRPEGHDVGQLLEADVALRHLAPDRVRDASRGPAPRPRSRGPRDGALMPRPIRSMRSPSPLWSCSSRLRDRGVGVGLELAEGEGLHLLHELVHADPLGERGVDVHRLAGDPLPLLLDWMKWRVRMLCSRSASLTSSTRMSPDMASRNLRRFSAARWLSLCASILRELGDAVDQPGDVLAEQLVSISSGVATVSSIVSWRMAVTIVSSSRWRSVRIPATSIGWL